MLLTGTYEADDGGIYFLRQIDDFLWWAGFSTESPKGQTDFHLGVRFTNIFQGRIESNTITGDWADLPRGNILQNGTLRIRISSELQLDREAETGGFGATRLTRVALPPRLDFLTRFDLVMRNDGNTLHNQLKPYKDFTVVVGNILEPIGFNLPANANRRYANFLCNEDDDFDEDEFDGDIVFHIQVEREKFDSQPDFLNGFLHNPRDITSKLDENNNSTSGILVETFDEPDRLLRVRNLMTIELIMYGKPGRIAAGIIKDCKSTAPSLMPGWMEREANSVLWNGAPLDGLVDFMRDIQAVTTGVRVTGALVLDCGHSLFGDCEENRAKRNNVEIHPVYSVEVLRNPLVRPRALTGMWAATDVGTYYLRELGDTLWWLGLSRDQGRSFANVFRGTIKGETISGIWADVPLGVIQNNGELTITTDGNGPASIRLTRSFASGGFGADRWEKLNDKGGPVSGPG